MKKINISKTILKTKWLTLLIVAIILIVLGRTVVSVALTKSSTVIGIGIDFFDGEFTVTTQSVVVSGGANAGNGSTLSYVLFTEKGKTLAQATDRIKQKAGLTLTLSHCNLVIMSKSVLQLNHLHLIEPLVKTLALPEQAIVVTSSESPQKLLSQNLPTTTAVPFYLQSALIENSGSDGIVRLTVKDFLVKSCSRSNGLIMPYVEILPLEDKPLGQTTDADFIKLKLNKSLVFNSNSSAVLDEELSQVVAFYNSDASFGCIDVELETGECVEFKVLKNTKKSKVENMLVKTEIKLSVSYVETQNAKTNEVISSSADVVVKAGELLSQKLTKNLFKCYEFSVEKDIDFLELENLVYQKVGRTLEEHCLQSISFLPTVKVDIKENA
ncbi:MAG: hypothetical protein RSB59_02955 [Clostridia bacterium]